jgi:phage-related protein
MPDSTPEQLKGIRRVGRPPLGEEPRQLIAIRVFHVATFAEALCLLHAFEKKTRRLLPRISKLDASGSARSWR